jgi:PAS domain S-box-containing protein
MEHWFSLYVLSLAITLFLALGLALLAWQKRTAAYALPLAGWMASIALWALGGLLVLALREAAFREAMHALAFGASLLSAVCILQFAASFAFGERGLPRTMRTAVWIQTFAGIATAFTNPWHRLTWTAVTPESSLGSLEVYTPGLWLFILLTFSYGYSVIGAWLLARIVFRGKRPQNRQAFPLTLAIALPLVAGIFSIWQRYSFAGLDLTPIAQIISIGLIAHSIFRWSLLDFIPIARDLVIENMDEGVIVLDPRDRVVDLNPMAQHMLGGTPPLRVGDSLVTLLELLEPPDAQIWILPDSQMEVQSISRNGRWIEIRGSTLSSRKGEVTGRLILLRDITDRRTSEEQKTRLANDYQFTLEHMQTNVFRMRKRADGKIVFVLNEGPVPKGLGQLTEVVRGKTLAEVMGPELARFIRPYYVKAFTGQPVSYEVDLGPVALMTMLFPIFEADDVVELAGSSVDITERIRAERELQQREAYQRAILDNVPYMAWMKNTRGEYLAINQPQADALGISRLEDLRGKTDRDVRSAEEAERILADDAAVQASGMRRTVEELVHREGEDRWVETFKAPIFDDDGTIIGTVGFSRDVTERKRIATELENTKTLLESALDQTPIPIMMAGVPDGAFRIVNRASRTFLGISPELDLIGVPLSEFAGKKTWIDIDGQGHLVPQAEFPLLLACAGQSIQNKEYGILRQDGSRRWELVTSVPIHNRAGDIIAAIMVFPDITETKLADALLISYARKLERSNRDLQDFASSASHDLQEPLRKIQAFGERLATRYRDVFDDEGRDYMARMTGAARRMQDMINALLDYSRVTTRAHPFIPVQLNQVASEAISDLDERVAQTGGEVKVQPLPEIEADPLQIRLLIQNLVGNALKFHRANTPPVVSIWADHPDAQTLLLHIEDNGIGFDPKYLDRIFQPFQRLHGRGEYEGSGMGLAICRKIVERHGGEITARSIPGMGTTFLITLPVAHPKGDVIL